MIFRDIHIVNGHPFSSSLCPTGHFNLIGCPVFFPEFEPRMEFEIIKNILASIVSAATLMWMLFKYLHKRDVTNAKLIADTIKEATQRAFELSHIESRVREIEEIQAENTKVIHELGSTLNARLDQLFIAIANIQSNRHE
jgi:hypothetical protein